MNIDSIIKQLQDYEKEYKTFMGITKFPTYEVKTRKVSQSLADTQGFESVAMTFYKPRTKQHTIAISTNLTMTKYVVFHEFTHMYDSEVYAEGNDTRNVGLSGYTEYHASQIELLQLLGVDRVGDDFSFTMDRSILTVSGEKSVYQYVKDKQQHAIDLFSRRDFPADISTLKSAFGVLYNYYGLRSICEMYATDYVEEIKNEAFLKIISSQNYVTMNNLMHGWLNSEQIELSIKIYLNIIFPLIVEHGFV